MLGSRAGDAVAAQTGNGPGARVTARLTPENGTHTTHYSHWRQVMTSSNGPLEAARRSVRDDPQCGICSYSIHQRAGKLTPGHMTAPQPCGSGLQSGYGPSDSKSRAAMPRAAEFPINSGCAKSSVSFGVCMRLKSSAVKNRVRIPASRNDAWSLLVPRVPNRRAASIPLAVA